MKIAIDGPSGAGKSTVAGLLAKNMGIVYLDTGAMYRAIALKAHDTATDFNPQKLTEMLENTKIEIVYKDGQQRVILDGADVSDDIRRHFVSRLASDISAFKQVRLFLVDIQRQLAARADSVLDGRDIGSFVLPDAEHKFYITATVEERARRRFLELSAKGEKTDLEKVQRDIEQRDHNDMTREFAPLKKASDAVEIDTTHMTAIEVAALIKQKIADKNSAK